MSLFTTAGPSLLVPLGALGLVFGSFVTALSYRLPRGESITRGRSRCPACGHVLTIPDLVPVLSWVVQGGACRHCRAKVSWRYPAIEAVTMALFIAAGLSVDDLTHLVLLLAMTPAMVALAVIDLEYQRLPNSLSILLAALALAWRWQGDGDILAGLTAAAAVGVVGVLLDVGFRKLAGRPGLGMGDTKPFALAGLALPLGAFLLFLTIAGVLGVIYGRVWRWRLRISHFPYAPAILAAFWLCLVAGEPLLQRLVSLRIG
ncbi:MAG: prepilin peptidase [Rhodospirillaceae bacterium]|nr:prepilin peptidase [Rhodospirillaceae bacterium]